MLADQVKQLLTAFVDGELSQRQRKAVVRLLHRSSEARELVRQMQEDAHRIKQLPRRKVEPSLVDDILEALAEQQPRRTASRPARRRWLPYVAASLAASLLIGAIGIAYWNSMTDLPSDLKEPFVKGNDKKPELPPRPEGHPTPRPRKTNPMLAHLVDGAFGGYVAPVPIEGPFVVSFGDLQKEGGKAGELVLELNREAAVQFDLIVSNNSLAMERLKAALHSQKVEVLVDPSADKALKEKKQAKVEYWVFAENLSGDELSRMLKDLSQPDISGMGGSVASPYHKLSLTTLTPTETQKIAGLLGLEPAKLVPPKNDKNPKPNPVKDWERKVVVLPVAAAATPSEQLRQFIQLRRASPGASQVLIKIRQE